MFNSLNPDLPFLNASELLSVASGIDALHSRTIKAIERLQRDVDAQKSAIANRWKTAAIGASDKRRIEAEEIRVATLTIRKNSENELDGLLKEAGIAHTRAVGQRGFYGSPVMTLNRVSLGDARRSSYQDQVAGIGPAEAMHLGQWAVSTGNLALAAALVAKVDAMPAGNRPYSGVALAEAMRLDEHRKAAEAIKIVEMRFQGIVIAIRAWKASRSNPLHAVGLSLMGRTLDSAVLKDMEAADGPA